MSFGFGANNNTSSGFGGFGSSNTGGFGGNSTTSGGSLFGGNTATAAGGFGSGGFGTNTNTTGGSLFGGNTSTSSGTGFGGFGQSNNNTTTNTGFGASTGGGLFGANNQNKAAGFGSTNTGGGMFGSTNHTTGGFGGTANNTSNPFGGASTTNTGFGASNTSNTSGGFGGFGGATQAVAGNNNNGTAAVPFTAIQEKDTAGTQAYQSITFQDPYKAKSFEELRVEDYLQGRRFGNSNGQAGSFGQSTGFGGFGATNNANTGNNMFGNTNTTATSNAGGFAGFGATANNNNTATTGFGANNNAGGGLFGQNKPAGGLFGTSTSGATTGGFGSTTGNTGGLFGAGNNNNTSTGFGANNTTAGGGLFGQNNTNNAQSNPFGGATNPNAGGGLFGNNNNNNQQKPGGLFGSTNTATAPGLFGAQNNQNQQSNPFGQANNNTANAGGGLFGNTNNNQAKPAFGTGFGASTTNTGFGANNNAAGGSLFGGNNATTNNNTTSLFGNTNNQQKPGGLFGNSTTTNNAGGGLFANTQQQPGNSLFGAKPTSNTPTGGLFGATNQAKPAGGLFGNTTTNTGSLFGNSNATQNNTAGNSLFGGLNSQTNNNTSSLFGGNNNQAQSQQGQNQLHASLTVSPYGNDQLFASLGATSPPVGPLATPLQGAKPTPKKNQSLLGSMRVNSPVYTPRASGLGRTGYGLAYSNYGTPNSSFSGSLTPGASSLLRPTGSLGSALTSRLNKSFSTSNLRGDGTPETGSLLRSAPLTPGSVSNRYGGGSMRKLRIDRTLRENLFEPPTRDSDADSRRVNFDETAEKAGDATDVSPSNQNALITEEQAQEERAQEERGAGLFKKDPRQNGATRPEMEQASGAGALTTVPENGIPPRAGSAPVGESVPENIEPGAYWTKPPLEQLKKMSRKQLEKVGNFTVGREGVGHIKFKSCDLTSVPLDEICGKIVELVTRNATVYPKDINKPPVGQGLNVPSTIVLEKSWPKQARGKRMVLDTNSKHYQGHVKRLKEIKDTKYVSYDQETGAWTFEVDHFTTYALDDDDDDEQMTDDLAGSSELSDVPATPDGNEETMQSIETASADVDDTFRFKLERRNQPGLPGAFDPELVSIVDEEREDSEDFTMSGGLGDEDPFVSAGGPVQAPPSMAIARLDSSINGAETAEDLEEGDDTTEMPGTFVPEAKMPRSILKPTAGFGAAISPVKLVTASWEDQLQRTMSPGKRDRRALREMQQSLMADMPSEQMNSPFKQSMLGRSALNESYLAQKSAKKGTISNSEFGKSKAFTTSMDIMNSLWASEKGGQKAGSTAKGFEQPNPKKPRLSNVPDIDNQEVAFHDNMKPSFNPALGFLTYSVAGSAPHVHGELVPALQPVVGEHKDVRFAKFAPALDLHSTTLLVQKSSTSVGRSTDNNKVPRAHVENLGFVALADAVKNESSILKRQEAAIWRLCSILFDPQDVGCAQFVEGLSPSQRKEYRHRITLEAFGTFWASVVSASVQEKLSRARTVEERALLCLTQNNVAGACELLASTRDYKLATMVAQLPGSADTRQTMQQQIHAWRKRKDWSEMSEAVRALYCVLAGEVCVVPGQEGAAEDRADEFCISESFGFTWQQSFGLRLFFGGHDNLEDVIQSYCEDADSDRESVQPTTLWDHGYEGDLFVDKEDTLMSLLRLSLDPKKTDMSNLLDPLTVSGSALNSRLAWQLATMLKANRVCSAADDKLAMLTTDYAAEAESSRDISNAAWILLHLDSSSLRYSAITSLLGRNGDKIFAPDDESNPEAQTLVQELHIPASLVWAAKASSAAFHDEFSHITWLMMAHNADQSNAGYDVEAHAALCNVFAPQAIIQEDYDNLAQLLARFDAAAANASHQPEGWELGGGVYDAYVRLLRLRPAERQGAQAERLVGAIRRGLTSMEDDSRNKTLEQRVAMLVMARLADDVAKELREDAEGGDAVMGGMMDMETSQASAALTAGSTGMGLLEVYRKAMGGVAL